MTEGTVELEEFEKFIRERFSAPPETNLDHRMADAIEDLLSKHQKDSIGTFLLDAAMMINRIFDFKEVAFGLRDPTDGHFKYAVTLGFLPATQEALRKISYSVEDMNDHKNYRDYKLGRVSEYVVDSPEAELRTFNRPALAHKKRATVDEFLEGDYIDVYLFGQADELIGWLELAGPKSGKVPTPETVRWLELVSSIIGRVVWERVYLPSQLKGQAF